MNKKPDIEFLISTMNRSDLRFLDHMFQHHNLNELKILIINQTTKDNILESDNENIRVVNAFEKGLSRSRNLAIKHATGEICFIADDDIEYLPEVIDVVTKAYQDYPDSALISFQYLRENNKTFKIYHYKSGYQHRLLHRQALTSFEMCINLNLVKSENIRFNTCFGLGAHFTSGEEGVFRDDLVRAGLKVAYVSKPIVVHYGKTSVDAEGSKKYTKALTATKYLQHKNFIYLWLIRYIWLLLKRKSISIFQISKIWIYGVTAVQDYKRLCSKQ